MEIRPPRARIKIGALACNGSRSTTVEKCPKKRDARAKLLFCLSKSIAFMPYSLLLPSPSWLRKLPNIHT